MAIFWGLILGIPLLAFGGGSLYSAEGTSRFIEWFKSSRRVALALTVFAWFWTAYECDTIGIDVFDMVLKRFPGQLWIMAAVLSWLMFIWMLANLSVRALTGILMLIPAELFKTTRPLLLDDGARRETYHLDSPTKGLHIKNNVWREFTNFSPDCVVMVLASAHYNEADYIRNYDDFLRSIGR